MLDVAYAPEQRQARTDRLIEALGNPATLPLTVGTAEVQLRYFLDERIVVRSLDGLLDERLGAYYDRGVFDVLGYLKDRKVEYLVQYPDLPSLGGFSYAALRHMSVGDVAVFGDVRFTRVSPWATRVQGAW